MPILRLNHRTSAISRGPIRADAHTKTEHARP